MLPSPPSGRDAVPPSTSREADGAWPSTFRGRSSSHPGPGHTSFPFLTVCRESRQSCGPAALVPIYPPGADKAGETTGPPRLGQEGAVAEAVA